MQLSWKAKFAKRYKEILPRLKICPNLSKEDEELDERLKTSITQNLQSLETVFKRYFPELKEKEAAFVRNQFSTALDVNDILDELQDQFNDFKNDSSERDVFQEMAFSQFWCAMRESYPQ